ncbi:hypothetical protein TNIN_103261 [Trichonephila inaurata madagascariensis]|uniref:Uncharacterized protein n=1 Tax=Trichonephila inaurata madagascariensis TaxID=2747483 RepID=A0A8X6IBL8_9ARAC|nr:hypothetical protein TNIN_103261 [Trichonephila inaurata madagascariensis]
MSGVPFQPDDMTSVFFTWGSRRNFQKQKVNTIRNTLEKSFRMETSDEYSPATVNLCRGCLDIIIEFFQLILKRYGSERLIDVPYSLGFAASYGKTVQYEISTTYHLQPRILSSESGTLE